MILAMANVGGLILFFFTLIGLAILGLFYLAYLSNCFVNVVQDTAAGNDETTWPDEPFMDWAHRVFVLLWLALVWLAPMGLILRLTKPVWLAEMPALGVVLGGLVLWAFFPFAVLSSLASETRWAFINLRVLTGLIRVAPTTAAFYLGSFLVVAFGLGVWIVAVLAVPLVLLPVAAVVGSICVFLYSRMLGRLALVLSRHKPIRRFKSRAATKEPAAPEFIEPKIEMKTVEDPWAAPKSEPTEVMPKPTLVTTPARQPLPSPPSVKRKPLDLDDEWEEGGTYEMAAPSAPSPSISELYDPPARKRKAKQRKVETPAPEPPPPPQRQPPAFVDDEEEGGTYEVGAAQAETPRTSEMYAPKGQPPTVDPGAPRPRPKIKVPKWPMTAGVVSFPFYASNRGALIGVAVGGVVVGGLLQAVIALFPF